MNTLRHLGRVALLFISVLHVQADKSQQQFNLELTVRAQDARKGYDLSRTFKLTRGPDDYADGNYNPYAGEPKLTLRLLSKAAPGSSDNIQFNVVLDPFQGVKQYPIATVLQTKDNRTVTQCTLMITDRGGSYFDPKQTGVGVYQYRTGMYWHDVRQPGKGVYRAPNDIGGWVRIDSVRGNLISGELQLIFYGSSGSATAMQAPWTPNLIQRMHRATLKGKFTAFIYGLENR